MDILILIIVLGVICLFAPWIGHVYLTKEYRKDYGTASYRKFKSEFDKYDWKLKKFFIGENLYDTAETCEVDPKGLIITFQQSSMIINNPVSFLLTKRYIHKHIKVNKNKK